MHPSNSWTPCTLSTLNSLYFTYLHIYLPKVSPDPLNCLQTTSSADHNMHSHTQRHTPLLQSLQNCFRKAVHFGTCLACVRLGETLPGGWEVWWRGGGLHSEGEKDTGPHEPRLLSRTQCAAIKSREARQLGLPATATPVRPRRTSAAANARLWAQSRHDCCQEKICLRIFTAWHAWPLTDHLPSPGPHPAPHSLKETSCLWRQREEVNVVNGAALVLPGKAPR